MASVPHHVDAAVQILDSALLLEEAPGQAQKKNIALQAFDFTHQSALSVKSPLRRPLCGLGSLLGSWACCSSLLANIRTQAAFRSRSMCKKPSNTCKAALLCTYMFTVRGATTNTTRCAGRDCGADWKFQLELLRL